MALDIAALLREFHDKYAPVEEPRFGTAHMTRQALLAEEMQEYLIAELDGDIIKVADALGDIVYVCFGTALCYGIDLDAIIAEIHRSNMTKDQPLTPGGKAVKGAGYRPPDIEAALARN